MGANFVNNIYTWHFFGLTMPYKTGICRISDNTHTNPPVNFPAVTNVIFNGCNVSLDPSIDSLIDWWIERVSERVSRWVSSDWWCDCLAAWLSMSQTHFIRSMRIWVSHNISSQDIHSRFIKADLWSSKKGIRFLWKQINGGHLFKAKEITKELTAFA